jgi:hypothetical protein
MSALPASLGEQYGDRGHALAPGLGLLGLLDPGDIGMLWL